MTRIAIKVHSEAVSLTEIEEKRKEKRKNKHLLVPF